VKRFTLTAAQKSAEGKVGHAVGKDIEALQSRKAEKQIGRAGNDDRRPERYPARGVQGKASKRRDSWADSGRRTGPNKRCWPFRRRVGVKLRRPPGKGPKRWWRSANRKAWLERPVAPRQLARLGHCFAERLLCPARAPTHGRAVLA